MNALPEVLSQKDDISEKILLKKGKIPLRLSTRALKEQKSGLDHFPPKPSFGLALTVF